MVDSELVRRRDDCTIKLSAAFGNEARSSSQGFLRIDKALDMFEGDNKLTA